MFIYILFLGLLFQSSAAYAADPYTGTDPVGDLLRVINKKRPADKQVSEEDIILCTQAAMEAHCKDGQCPVMPMSYQISSKYGFLMHCGEGAAVYRAIAHKLVLSPALSEAYRTLPERNAAAVAVYRKLDDEAAAARAAVKASGEVISGVDVRASSGGSSASAPRAEMK